MSWWNVGMAAASVASNIYQNNRSNQQQNSMLNSVLGNQLDPTKIGSNALAAQGSLAPIAIGLNNQYAPQFAASNNNALLASLFGSDTLNKFYGDQLAADPTFAKLNPAVQSYLQNAAARGGLNSFTGNQYQDLMNLYQGMGNQLTGTDESNAAFNKWTEDMGFGGWGDPEGNALAAGLSKLGAGADGTGGIKSPGVADMIGMLDKQLNPEQAAALEALKGAAGKASATVTAPNVNVAGMGAPTPVNQSGAAASLGAFINNGTAPQVQGPQGVNQGMENLSNLLGSSSYQQVNAAQMQAPGGPNLAGNAALAAGPQMASAQQGQIGQSQAPVTIQAPTGFERAGFQSVTGPSSFERVNAPGAVGNIGAQNIAGSNVTAQTGFERVAAPNVGLTSLQVGQNKVLNDLTNLGFNANRPIMTALEGQAMGDLALGGQLSGDQQRLAQQAARSAAEARGMVGSNSAILGEVQRQLDMSRALQNERRQFAQGVEQQGFGQLATQREQATNVADVTNRFLGLNLEAGKANNDASLQQGRLGLDAALANQAAGLEGNRLNLQAGLANQANALDAARANQSANLQAALANQQTQLAQSGQGLQASLANQQAGLDLSRLGLQAGTANQQAALQAALANQTAGLDLSRMGLAAQTSNAANAMNNNQFNASQLQQGSQFNANQQNEMARLMAQLGLQANQFNAGQQNNMAQFNAGQMDADANRQMTANQTNANLAQQAALANQQAFQQNWMNQMQGSNSLANLFNVMQGQSQDAQAANQNAWLGQRGQTIGALNNLMNSDNQLAQFNAGLAFDTNKFNTGLNADLARFNATMGLDAAKFNAGQQQQDFANQLAYQQAVDKSRLDPMSAMNFANGQMNWGMFDPFNAAIMSMYAANQKNQMDAMISATNNKAASESGMIGGIGGALNGLIGLFKK